MFTLSISHEGGPVFNLSGKGRGVRWGFNPTGGLTPLVDDDPPPQRGNLGGRIWPKSKFFVKLL